MISDLRFRNTCGRIKNENRSVEFYKNFIIKLKFYSLCIYNKIEVGKVHCTNSQY